MNPLAVQIIVDILVNQMDMPVNNVWVRDQNRKIPITEELFIAVGMVDSKIIGASNTPYSTYEGMSELQQVVMQENIQVDIFSRDTMALYRAPEVIAALNSTYSQQQQELYGFKIFRIPRSFVNASGAEGGSDINRFTMIIAAHTFLNKQKVIDSPSGDYFDIFETRVDDENTIGETNGLFKFTITPETPNPEV